MTAPQASADASQKQTVFCASPKPISEFPMPSSPTYSGSATFHRPILEEKPVSAPQVLLQDLLESSLVLAEDWESLPPGASEGLLASPDRATLLTLLQEHGLLNEYQTARVDAGTRHGLVLGNYRVLDRLGAGGMGIVFRAEHCRMRRVVAIKVLPVSRDMNPKLLMRFFAEIRAVAQLQHPNIVAAFDAGIAPGAHADAPDLHYFVMEYVPGEDLEQYVEKHGPLPVPHACNLVHQVGSALAEAHKHNLVHRDIKPPNIRITPEEQAKLLDFGLARQFRQRHTEPGTMLGTIDYMAPEQARDASTVDIRADLYGLGGVLFWCLTGRPPFPTEDSVVQAVTRRLTQPPPSVRTWRPEIPPELDAVVARMMALNPEDRHPTPQTVMRALLPFLKHQSREILPAHPTANPMAAAKCAVPAEPSANPALHRLLIVDDESGIRNFCRFALETEGILCEEAANGVLALEAIEGKSFDLVLLDIDLPHMGGVEVLRRLRERPPCPHLKIIMFSGRTTSDEMAQMLVAGADNYLTKPFSIVQLRGQVKAALRMKEAQDRTDLLNQRLLGINGELERNLNARDCDLVHARNALVLALAKLVEHRDSETGAHILRLQRYSRRLAEEAQATPPFSSQVDAHFVDMLECCAPLHDIGKVGLPDHILLKPGKLNAEERLLMQAHTLIGAETLQEVANHHGSALAFLQMAIDIARHHHERFDGTGYPDHLVGSAIPLAARLVAIGDVYDALRSRRVYKPALSHAATVQVITEGSPGHFDPALIPLFHRCATDFERIFHELAD
jgi:response regulator RpfG family c-di-GMP phosphodiesterase